MKGILSYFGVLFCAAILVSGCSKPEEKKVEAPPVQKEMVQEKAPVVKQEMEEEKVEPVAESATLEDQAVEAAKQMGQEALDKEIEKLPEEQQQAVDMAKQYGGYSDSAKAPTDAAPDTPPADTGTSLEDAAKEKAIQEGMKLPSKY